MTGIEMPDETVLPLGAHRDLVVALHKLYDLAGRPAYRVISRKILANNSLPATASHDTVSKILRGIGGVRPWQTVESLTRALVTMSVHELHADTEVKLIQDLWRAARQQAGCASDPSAPSVVDVAADKADAGAITQIAHTRQVVALWQSPKGPVEIFDRQLVMDLFGQAGESDV